MKRADTLLGRFGSGDTSAADACVDRYGDLVWSLARRFTRTREDAEDAVQEIFLDLWRTGDRYDPERSSEAAFVAMVAHRRLIDRLRRTRRRPSLEPLSELPAATTAYAPEAERHADLAAAARAIEALRPEHRNVLYLSVLRGLSHAEIAASTGLAVGTVKSRLRRALARVRRAMRTAP